jgi:hypothetical protein
LNVHSSSEFDKLTRAQKRTKSRGKMQPKMIFALFFVAALPLSREQLSNYAESAFETMMRYYVWDTGYFGDPAVLWPVSSFSAVHLISMQVWTSGNTFETLANYYELTGDLRALEVLANSFALVQKDYSTPYLFNGRFDLINLSIAHRRRHSMALPCVAACLSSYRANAIP